MFIRKEFPSDKINDEYLKNKYKRIETLLKSMKSKILENRPNCYKLLEEGDKWVTSLDNIEETEEYKEFINQFHNNSINDESLVKYAKYHFKSRLEQIREYRHLSLPQECDQCVQLNA